MTALGPTGNRNDIDLTNAKEPKSMVPAYSDGDIEAGNPPKKIDNMAVDAVKSITEEVGSTELAMSGSSTVEKILMVRSLEDGGNQQYEYLVKWQGFAYVHCRLVSNARICTPAFALASLNAVLCSISH